MRVPRTALALAAGWLASLSALTQSTAAGSLQWTPTRVETTEGPKRSVDAEEGRLWVDADPDHPTGRTIGLRVVRFKATTGSLGPPLVYLAGGPGGSGVLSAAGDRFPLFMALRAAGDVIAIDQRGVRSEPFPSCRTPFRVPFDRPLSLESLIEAYAPPSKACVDRWTPEVDLRVFNTANSAADLETLRVAIGADRLNLLAISYGTHLALAALKRYPALVGRVVLAGVEGPDHTLKLPSEADEHFARIAALVQSDDDARKAVPNLRALVDQAMARLAEAPPTLQVRTNGAQHRITVGPNDLRLSLWETIQERDDIEALPARAAQIARGDFAPVAEWAVARRLVPGLSSMMFTTDCASGASPERLVRITRETPLSLFGDAINWPFPSICASWPHVDLGSSFREPVRSQVPTLFLSGNLDGRTPVSNAVEVSRGFTAATLVTIVNGGHDDDLLIASPAIGDTILRFLRGTSPLSDRIELPPLKFRTR